MSFKGARKLYRLWYINVLILFDGSVKIGAAYDKFMVNLSQY